MFTCESFARLFQIAPPAAHFIGRDEQLRARFLSATRRAAIPRSRWAALGTPIAPKGAPHPPNPSESRNSIWLTVSKMLAKHIHTLTCGEHRAVRSCEWHFGMRKNLLRSFVCFPLRGRNVRLVARQRSIAYQPFPIWR